MGKDGRAQITTNYNTLVTTSCMSEGDMVVFTVEPNDKAYNFCN
jgi:hypothetical protein